MPNSRRFLNNAVEEEDHQAFSTRGFSGAWLVLSVLLAVLCAWVSIEKGRLMWTLYGILLAMLVLGFFIGRMLMEAIERTVEFVDVDDKGMDIVCLKGTKRRIEWSEVTGVSVIKSALRGTSLHINLKDDEVRLPPTMQGWEELLETLSDRVKLGDQE